MLRDRPLPVPAAFADRPYQVRGIAAANEQYAKGLRRLLMVMATGTGKTVVFSKLAKQMGGGLIVAHRDSLIRQAAKKLHRETGLAVATEKAERYAWNGAKFIVASVQTLKGARLEDFFRRFQPGFIVLDEAHRSTARSYVNVLEAAHRANPEVLALGVTATADRADGIGMWNVYSRCETESGAAFVYDIREAVDDAYLTPVESVPVPCAIDLDKINLRSGDLAADELDDAVAELAGDIARAMLESCPGRTIGFTPGVKTAELTADALNRLRPGCARVIHGAMDDYDKERLLQAHQGGEFDYLLNCAVLTEGYDDEKLLYVFDAAPTKSRVRFAQKLGRVTRLWSEEIGNLATPAERLAAVKASPKPWARYRDLRGHSSRHRLAGPADLLGGRATPEERELANKILAEKGGGVDEALAEAKERIAEDKARADAAAARARKAKVSIGEARTAWELYGVAPDEAEESLPARPEDRITPGQQRMMRQRRIPIPANCSKATAKKILDKDIGRQRHGRAVMADILMLRTIGIDGRAFSRAQVARLRAHFNRHGWRHPEPGVLDALLQRTPGEDDA
jgi:superfamily II DNA or RNA helicase